MVEYYRGILLACDSLKKAGISTNVRAWNVNIDADIRQTLLQEGASDCDIIFGPLYTLIHLFIHALSKCLMSNHNGSGIALMLEI